MPSDNPLNTAPREARRRPRVSIHTRCRSPRFVPRGSKDTSAHRSVIIRYTAAGSGASLVARDRSTRTLSKVGLRCLQLAKTRVNRVIVHSIKPGSIDSFDVWGVAGCHSGPTQFGEFGPVVHVPSGKGAFISLDEDRGCNDFPNLLRLLECIASLSGAVLQ